MRRLAPLTLAVTLLVGCTVGPRYQRPELELPEEIRGGARAASSGARADSGAAAASLADRAWWEILDDEVLLALVDEALRQGHDARLAAWRVEEARAAAGIARSLRQPAVQAGAGWSRGRSSERVAPGLGSEDLYDVRLGVSWELDLWGRLRRLDEAARARYLASEEARRGVLLSLVADVATGYIRLRALDRELEIARRTADAFGETRDLFERRFAAGLASGLETASAEASLAATAASIPDLARQIAAQENQLALLLGRHPGDLPRGAALEEQPLPPEVPAGLPSDLLRRRPDLRQAEQELVAANAEVGVAVAEMFPSLSLTGAFGGLAPEISELFGDGRTWSLGGGLLGPLVQGRRLQDRHRAAVARWQQARVRYEASVNQAFAEVSTALVAYDRLADVERQQARAVASYREAVRLAGSRYLSGLADYLEVLQAQQQLYPAERSLAEIRFARLATLVELYRALGGGWRLPDAEWAGEDRLAAAPAPSHRAGRE